MAQENNKRKTKTKQLTFYGHQLWKENNISAKIATEKHLTDASQISINKGGAQQMNYVRICLILSMLKALYDLQLTTELDKLRQIKKHIRRLQRLKENLTDLCTDITVDQRRTINKDCDKIIVSIYRHFRRIHKCPLLLI